MDSNQSQCNVCQAPASRTNYGAVSCAPCKMFFKRNAQLQNNLRCLSNGQCEITLPNRHLCPSCRLQKCFHIGMQLELIRGPTFKRNIKRKKSIINTSQTSTVNLLRSNSSIFSSDQTLLLSTQISSSNDQYHHQALLLAEQYLFHQNVLPLKYRFKLSSLRPFLSSLFIQIGYLFLNNEHFQSLHFDDRLSLVGHQLKYVLLFSSSMIIQQSHLLDYVGFRQSIECCFGRMIFHSNALLSVDIVYMKLSLRLICFCLFDYEEMSSCEPIRNRRYLMEMENIYVELLWKYLLYVYDEKEGMKYVVNLVGYLLNMIDDIMKIEKTQLYKPVQNCRNIMYGRTIQVLCVCLIFVHVY